MTTVTKKFTADYAHRLMYHPDQCHNLHGHTATIEITLITREELGKGGMIIDFGILKEKLKDVIGQVDHCLILNEADPLVSLMAGQGLNILVMPCEPTAENLSASIGELLPDFLPPHLIVESVVFYETPNNYATWSRK